MSDIQAEGNRLEVLATGIQDRCKILVTELTEEAKQCEAGGEYSYGGMLQASKLSHDPKQTAEQSLQSALQTSRAHAMRRFTREEIQKYLKPSLEANQSITFWNLTETIQNITGQLETDIHALIAEKNMLSVASSSDSSHLDNLEDDMGRQPPMGMNLLEAESDNASDTSKAQPALLNVSATATADNTTGAVQVALANANASADNTTGAVQVALASANTSAAAPADNATLTETLKAATLTERLQAAEIKRQKIAHSSAQVAQQQVVSSGAAATGKGEIGDIALVNLTFGIDKQVVDLAADVSILGEQKHE